MIEFIIKKKEKWKHADVYSVDKEWLCVVEFRNKKELKEGINEFINDLYNQTGEIVSVYYDKPLKGEFKIEDYPNYHEVNFQVNRPLEKTDYDGNPIDYSPKKLK